MTDAEMQFFMGSAGALPLYAELRRRVLELWPETEIRVAKTQISFRERYGWAFVSTRRMKRGCAGPFINLSLGLGRRPDTPRVFAASEPYPGRWTNHICICSAEEIDGGLMDLLAGARLFVLTK